MEIVHGLPQPINERATALTVGAFDGVHRGHQHLISATVRRARAQSYQSAVMTFDPHPDLVLNPQHERLYLADLEERAELIAELGVDLLIVLPFSQEIMALDAREFMERICKAVALRELVVGWDFALGRRREGNLTRLREIGREIGYSVHPAAQFAIDGTPVSSTRIRAALSAGDVEGAATLLGRPFSVRGQITQGDQRGRTIGFPTANLAVDRLRMLPGDGVYVCNAWRGRQRYGAVTNVGLRPTFDGTRRTVEAYLLDFVGDLYGEVLRLEFRHRLRGEQKFEGIRALVAQINRDVAAAREWLKVNGET
jgi:riboflavin kinase / FMN adenylyltransferase